jgi:phosphohistidine phosphatase
MKSLLVVRHAKSSWESEGQRDFDRPLNDRGRRDAPMMADRLVTRGIIPDLLVSSPAVRAKTTAELFASRFGTTTIFFKPELYHAPSPIFYQVAGGLDDIASTAILFSHNPGITDFVSELTSMRVDNMPTCGVFAVRAPIERWSEFRAAVKEFWFFDYPKA